MNTSGSKPNNDILASITRREKQVLDLLRQGKTSTEIAGELSISVLTVRSHIKRIYRKLDVHNKIEALQKAAFLPKH